MNLCTASVVATFIATALFSSLPIVASDTSSNPVPSVLATRSELLNYLANNASTKNAVYSPHGVRASLIIPSMGLENSQFAKIVSNTVKMNKRAGMDITVQYGNAFPKSRFQSIKKLPENPQLTIVNRVFVDNKLQTLYDFSKIPQSNPECEVKNSRFMRPPTETDAVGLMKLQAENKMFDLLRSKRNVSVTNELYFQAKWLLHFSELNTRKKDFYISDKRSVKVDTMVISNVFRASNLSALNAKAIELPYKKSGAYMLILLPNERTGLKELENKLKNVNLTAITDNMQQLEVVLSLPKFEISYDISMKLPIHKTMCPSAQAATEKVDPETEYLPVNQKVLLKVSEGGSEVPGDTFYTFDEYPQDIITVDHPFVFSIRSKKREYFRGHVTAV